MKVVILNWSQGENDPFTVLNQNLAKMFYRCGKNVHTLQFTDPDWVNQLQTIADTHGVEFVYTWQGIGSGAELQGTQQKVFDVVKVPLMCVHGDHPSYQPMNHQFDGDNCFHLYTNADFARYSNAHFRRHQGASVIDIPRLFIEEPLAEEGEAVFHVVKNITPTQDLEKRWQKELPAPAAEVYLLAAEVLKYLVQTEKYVEMHEIMDALIISEKWEWLDEKVNPGILHHYHNSLDYYIRSYKSQLVLEKLRDVPLHIYGRGWHYFEKDAPSCWQFFDGCDMKDSQKLYYSQYGIVDVSPSKRLHDRTRRAMVNGRGFLTSANLEDSFEDLSPFDGLFYDFRDDGLRERCEQAMRDPKTHHEKAKAFATRYHDTFHYRGFVLRMEQLARIVNASHVQGAMV